MTFIRTGETRRAYPRQTPQELAQQRATWNCEPRYHSETEMTAHFRENGVRAILDLGYAKHRPLEEMRTRHDYAIETEAAHSDVILGPWLHIEPQRAGPAGVKELRRCIDEKIGCPGYAVSASLSPPASEPEDKPLKDRILFEGGYPLFSYERLGKDWHAEGYPPQVLAQVFFRNAKRFLAEVGFKGRI